MSRRAIHEGSRDGGRVALLLLGLACATCGGGEEDEARADPPAASVSGVSSPPPRARPPFAGRSELATRGLPEGVLVQDLDGDGRQELVAVTRSPGSLHLWRSPLQPPLVVPLADYPLGPLAVRLGGRTLVAVAPRAEPSVLLFDLLASEPARPVAHFPLQDVPRAFAAGDLDGDGVLEIALATRGGALVLLDRGGPREVAALAEGQPTCLAFAGGAIVVGFQASESLSAYVPGPAGAFEQRGRVELGGIPRAIAVRDRGEDGFELLVAAGDQRLVRVALGPLLNDADAPAPIFVDSLPSVPIALAAAGEDELVVLGHGALSVTRVFLDGEAAEVGPPLYVGQDAWDLALGDLDDDGLEDLVIANRGASRVSLLYGSPMGGFEAGSRVSVGRGPHSLAAADLDGDGLPELCVIEAMQGGLAVLERREAGYVLRQRLDARPAADRVRAADIDGDGLADVCLLVRDDAGARLRIHRGEAGGRLSPLASEAEAGRGAGDLLLVDLDDDGRPEAVVADPEDGAVHVLRLVAADGALAPRRVASLAVPSAPRGLAASSAAPGHVVVALGEPGPRTGYAILVARATDDALVLEELAHVASPLFGLDVEVLEDGLIALLGKPSRGDGPGRVALFRAADGALLAEEPTGQRPYALATGDFDGDGRLDLCVGAQNSHHVNVWRRGPEAALERMPDLGVGRGVLDVLFEDLDGDGLADVAAANNFSNDISILRAR